jgi:hypothetical protein
LYQHRAIEVLKLRTAVLGRDEGLDVRMVAVIAPRRAPDESSMAQAASQIFMNDTGPDATLPVRPARLPAGRSVEKS